MRQSTVAVAFFALLSCQAAIAQAVGDAAPPPLHVVMKPAQDELKGPNPYDTLLSDLAEVLWLAGPPGAVLGGAAVAAADHSRIQGTDPQQSLRTFDSNFFDFRQAIVEGLEDLALDPGIDVAEIHEHDFEAAESATVRWLHKNLQVEHVLLVDPVYYISPGLDRARLRIRLAYYRANPDRRPQHLVFRRDYEYLSPSRGDLFRPWRNGEKEALVAAVERQFAEKTSRYPRNRKAYEKDRREVLEALAGSDRILPAMALNEGWPGDTLAAELGVATTTLMSLIRADLRDVSTQPPANRGYVEFAGLAPDGKRATFEGYAIGAHGTQTAYRDVDGNVYSVPATGVP